MAAVTVKHGSAVFVGGVRHGCEALRECSGAGAQSIRQRSAYQDWLRGLWPLCASKELISKIVAFACTIGLAFSRSSMHHEKCSLLVNQRCGSTAELARHG